MKNDFGNKSPDARSGSGSPGTLLPSSVTGTTAVHRDNFDQAEFDLFRQFLQDVCGIALGDNKQYLVSNRICRLLDEHNHHYLSDLDRALKHNTNLKLR